MQLFRILIVLVVLVTTALSVGAANLLTNGSFESKNMKGWTTWKSNWTTGEHFVVQKTDKKTGGYAAKFNCVQGSFGLYQQVKVTPGERYKVTGDWKGSYSRDNNWFEVILIDGAFSVDEADTVTVCEKNFISAYDPATFKNNRFGWESISAGYRTTPYIKNGERTATGNVMTLVIKTGGFGNPHVVFDNLSLEVVSKP